MIRPARAPAANAVARHYDELDPFYRAAWGEELHHGLWERGDETIDEAVRALSRLVAERAGVGPGDRVVDVGCGYGGPARFLVAEHGCDVLGVTLSPTQHAFATGVDTEPREGGRAVRTVSSDPARAGPARSPRFLLGDWMELELGDAGFDAVIAIESLSHMPDKLGCLRKARAALHPGGRVVLATWMAGDTPSEWQRRYLLEPICDEGRLSGLGTAGEYRGWIEAAGLELVQWEDLSDRVRRTWSVCLRRMAAVVATEAAALRYLSDGRNSERRFALTVARMWLAYRTGALRYGLFTALSAAPGRT